MPLGHFFAAETVCFLGFTGYLRQPGRRRWAGPPCACCIGAWKGCATACRRRSSPRPGWARWSKPGSGDYRPEYPDPLIGACSRRGAAAIAAGRPRETPRQPSLRGRSPEPADGRAARFGGRLRRLSRRRPGLACSNAPMTAPDARRPDLLLALEDLRVDAADVMLPRLRLGPAAHRVLGVRLLAHAAAARPSDRLCPHGRDSRCRCGAPRARLSRAYPPPRPSVPDALPYADLLRPLRGHPAPDVEAFLLAAARDWDPTYRGAAVAGSAGGSRSIGPGARYACRSRGSMHPGSSPRCPHRPGPARRSASHRVVPPGPAQRQPPTRLGSHPDDVPVENLTLLWPELDQHRRARRTPTWPTAPGEALEQMQEDLEYRMGTK